MSNTFQHRLNQELLYSERKRALILLVIFTIAMCFRTADYLLGLPLLGDYLEDGLAVFDEGIVDDSDTREGVDGENEPLDGMKDKPARQ